MLRILLFFSFFINFSYANIDHSASLEQLKDEIYATLNILNFADDVDPLSQKIDAYMNQSLDIYMGDEIGDRQSLLLYGGQLLKDTIENQASIESRLLLKQRSLIFFAMYLLERPGLRERLLSSGIAQVRLLGEKQENLYYLEYSFLRFLVDYHSCLKYSFHCQDKIFSSKEELVLLLQDKENHSFLYKKQAFEIADFIEQFDPSVFGLSYDLALTEDTILIEGEGVKVGSWQLAKKIMEYYNLLDYATPENVNKLQKRISYINMQDMNGQFFSGREYHMPSLDLTLRTLSGVR